VPHLEKRLVLAALKPPDVPCDLRMQALQPLLQRRALLLAAQFVGVESDEAQLAAMGHHDIVVARVFVVWVVVSVIGLVGLNAEQRAVHEFAVINPAQMIAVTVRCGYHVVVYEILEVAVDVRFRDCFCAKPRIVRKLVLVAAKTAAVVTPRAVVPINRPILAIDAAELASSICNGGTAAVDAVIFHFLMLTNLRTMTILTPALAPSMGTDA